MAAVGGSIESVSLRGRSFNVPADNEAQLNIGGFNNEVQANGNGTARIVKTRVVCSVEGVLVEIDHNADDLTFLQDLANLKDFFPGTITMADGTTYEGQLQITGAVQGSTQNATASITLMGTGELTAQL